MSVIRGGASDGGVEHGELLIRFAEAVLGEDDAALAAVRERVLSTLGPLALVDSSAVAALFNAIDRIADATGIPVEEEKLAASVDYRERLGIRRYQEP
jgi:hypothetical protein